MAYRLSWSIIDYHGQSLTIMDYHGLLWTIMDYHGLSWTIMDYYGLLWTIKDYQGLSRTIKDYHGLSWTTNHDLLWNCIFQWYQGFSFQCPCQFQESEEQCSELVCSSYPCLFWWYRNSMLCTPQYFPTKSELSRSDDHWSPIILKVIASVDVW